MSGPFGSQQWMYSSGFYPHEIGNSARLDSNAYYTRTPSSAGNRKTWTWSAWLKISSFNGYHTPFAFGDNSTGGTDVGAFFRLTTDKLEFSEAHGGVNSFSLITNQLFRDPSAWYHFVFSVDTTQSTSSNRIKIYVNGSQITSFSTETYPSQNFDTSANQSGLPQRIGMLDGDAGVFNQFYDGYITEVNFIDGSALDPSYFGETKADTWIPKKYTGSYGSNGYYLDFATRATDPIDASGNGNNWSSVNVASTDWMLDSPTNNFATLNPLIERWAVTTNTYTEGNLKVASSGTSALQFATMQADKIYFEMLCTANNVYPHICVQEEDLQSEYGSYAMFYSALGQSRIGSVDTTIATYGVGDIVALAYDHYGGEGRIYKNGTLIRTQTGQNFDSYMETYLAGGVLAAGDGAIFNFGQDSSFAGNKTAQGNTDSNGIGDFYYTPPSGFLAICSANLPDPVAAINPAVNNTPQDHFNPVLYTGTGSSSHAITGVGFQPDLVWIKSRSNAASHGLHDVNRIDGTAEEILYSDSSAASNTGGAYISSFDSDGFTANNNSSGNGSGTTYVSWNWKAGGTGVNNTTGGIASTVSANSDIGVSFIKWQGDSNTSGTVGTGLSSSAPLDMVIIKRRDSTSNWHVGHRFSGQGANFAYHCNLDDAAALSGNAPYMMGTQSSTNGDRLYITGDGNINTAYYIAYCFQSVEGFSKFAQYEGNGSADGPFIYCGFKPAYLMVKSTSVNNWVVHDTTRSPYNVSLNALFPNITNAEYTSANAYDIDLLSNGFKLRSSNTDVNHDGRDFIFMAFAEMPFKYANAR